MSETSHPDQCPFMVVEYGDQGNPPYMRWYTREKAAIDAAKKTAFDRGKVMQVFTVSLHATVRAQPPIVEPSK